MFKQALAVAIMFGTAACGSEPAEANPSPPPTSTDPSASDDGGSSADSGNHDGADAGHADSSVLADGSESDSGAIVDYTSSRWVGWWGAAMADVGTGDYIADTAINSNIVWIGRDATLAETKTKLDEARAHGLKAQLYVTNVFFPAGSSVLVGDYANQFQAYWDSVKDYHDIIVGLYVHDEPYLNNQTSGWVRVPNATLHDSLTKVVDTIHTIAPGRFTAISFSDLEVAGDSSVGGTPFSQLLPANVDLFGVNCYAALGCDDTHLATAWNTVLSVRGAKQHLMVTLDAFWSSPPGDAVDAKLAFRMRTWEALISAHQDAVLGYFPFIYQSNPATNIYGADSLPNTRRAIAAYMMGLQGLGTCSGSDYVQTNPTAGTTSTWANAPMCAPACEWGNFVRRDILGKVTDQWVQAPPPYCPSSWTEP